MKMEAIKVENGFLIPFNDTLKKDHEDKIFLHVEIIERSEDKKAMTKNPVNQEPPFPKDFWESPSLEELAALQNVQPIQDIHTLFGTWPGDIDDGFEEAIYELRHSDDSKEGGGMSEAKIILDTNIVSYIMKGVSLA